MPFQARAEILGKIGAELGAGGVLAYVTGDRENLTTQVSPDALRRLPRHLEAIGRQKSIALVLYTQGGDTNTPWPFVNFVRQYCEELWVVVPFWSLSSGTLITLGADRIYMSRFGTLSPIDPSVTNGFNPQDPTNPQLRIPIAVEDVSAFFDLASEQGGDPADAVRRLAEAVHPLALGNVKRSIEQIRQLATKLTRLRKDEISDDALTNLVNSLTTQLYSHSHLITRDEAKELGLPVHDPSDELEKLMLAYYDELKKDLNLLDKFDPAAELQQHLAQQPPAPAPPAVAPAPPAQQVPPGLSPATPSAPTAAPAQPPTVAVVPAAPAPAPTTLTMSLERAYCESTVTCDAFITRGRISQQPQALPPQLQAMIPMGQQPALPLIATLEVTSERWEELA